MCKICRQYICPESCPSYIGESAEYGRPQGECSACGKYIYEGDICFYIDDEIYCLACERRGEVVPRGARGDKNE